VSPDPDKRWRDVMAYNSQCADSGFTCQRRLYFSTPLVTFDGDIAGDASTADGARTLNETRTIVANFRDSGTPSVPGAFSKSLPANGTTGVSTSPTLSWGTSSDVASYEYCIDTSNNSACDAAWTSTGTSTNVGLSGLAYGTTH